MKEHQSPLQPSQLGTVLSVWAHPDDETYLSAGVMAAAADLGQRVVCVSVTAGEHGTDDPQTWPPERLARTRRWEFAAAMAVVGVREHRILDLPDGALSEQDERGIALVGRLLDEVIPDTILTFGPDGMTFHPDHVTVHHWVTRAWELRERPGRLLYATATADEAQRLAELGVAEGIYMTDQRPAGADVEDLALHLRLDGAALDRKLAALRAIASQTTALASMMGQAAYASLAAEEAFVEAGTSTLPR